MSENVSILNLKLPSNFSIRKLQVEDAAIATDLVRAVDIAACGETTTTVDELESDIASSWKSGAGSYGVFNFDKLIVALLIQNELLDARGCFFDLFADPESNSSQVQEICESLITEVENLVQEFLKTERLQPDYAKTALYEEDRAFRAALQERNFEQHRTYWRLRIDHSEASASSNPNLEIVDFLGSKVDWHGMHNLSSEIFKDHYDFHPKEFSRWKADLTSGVHDPNLWRIALMQGEPVGYCWGSNRFAEERFGYVASIGVLRNARGNGVAKALLADAFARDYKLGMQGTLLHCDAANPTGATALYESAGMRVDRVYVAYRKMIVG